MQPHREGQESVVENGNIFYTDDKLDNNELPSQERCIRDHLLDNAGAPTKRVGKQLFHTSQEFTRMKKPEI